MSYEVLPQRSGSSGIIYPINAGLFMVVGVILDAIDVVAVKYPPELSNKFNIEVKPLYDCPSKSIFRCAGKRNKKSVVISGCDGYVLWEL